MAEKGTGIESTVTRVYDIYVRHVRPCSAQSTMCDVMLPSSWHVLTRSRAYMLDPRFRTPPRDVHYVSYVYIRMYFIEQNQTMHAMQVIAANGNVYHN